MAQKSEDSVIIIFAVGVILGGLFAYKVLKKLQQQTQTQPQTPPPTMTAAGQPSQYRRDTEFIRWYTETIIKPSIERASRESADNVIRQFTAVNPPAEVQTLGGAKTSPPRTHPKPVKWMITRDSEGAIASIETVKEPAQRQTQTPKPEQIPPYISDKINMGKEHNLS